MAHAIRTLLAILPVLAAGTAAARAQSTLDYCVRCTIPAATHVCTVTVEEGVVSVSEWQAFCASQVAFDAGHHQCRAAPGLAGCDADRRFAYRSTLDRGIVTEDAVAREAVPGEPGPRPGGVFEGAVDFVRRTGEDVGDTIGQGVEAVGETAGEVGRGLLDGAEAVGEGVARGVGCVFTLGRQC